MPTQKTQPEPLKYLFEVHFKDGSRITQTQDDASLTTPGKNAVYDVLQRIDDVHVFGLFSVEDSTAYKVCLDNGQFAINDIFFQAGDCKRTLQPDTKYRLIYYKLHTHQFNGTTELAHEIKYVIGWQATIDGQNVESTIGVK
jgi:hypothetical protein